MSAAEFTPLPPASKSPFAAETPSTFWKKSDTFLEWLGDFVNPIVVKEARQALKSRQFTLTFYLLLICGACWTALGVSMNIPEVLHVPSAPFMVRGYYFLLSIPMLLVVPFVAFRSLAAELEDGTFELLSITTLQSRQIVLGKLASAMLQMMVYYSALAPCIAFTYQLKGLDIVTILLFLGFLWLASMVLSSLALALGTVTRARHWQVLLSVLIIAGLMLFLLMWLGGAAGMFETVLMGTPYDQSEFWMGLLATTTILLSFIALFLTLAAGQISFSSDNRSTPIRWVLLVQHVLWFGWMLYVGLNTKGMGSEGPLVAFVMGTIIATIYWWIMGSFLIGERAELSPRVRRSLPQSMLGRTLLTWLNPGSGTGYTFAFVNLATFIVMLGFLVQLFTDPALVSPWGLGRGPSLEKAWIFSITAMSYMALYLGVGRFFVLAVRNRVPNSVWFSFLLQIVFVAFGTLIPLVLQFSLLQDSQDYTVLQFSNPFWTLAETLNIGGGNSYDPAVELTLFLVCASGIAMACLHLFLAALEIDQTRMLAPQRVLEEDAAMLAAHTVPKRKNPWDDPTP